MAPSLLVLTDFYQPANHDHALTCASHLAAAVGARLVLPVHRDALLDPERFTGLGRLTEAV